MGPKDLNHMVKGKRTKRRRPQSPVPFTIPAQHSPTGYGGGGYGSSRYVQKNNCNTNSTPAPASSSEFQGSTTDEEDTARCLILLAQGQFNIKRYTEAPPTASNSNGKTAGIYVYECKTCNRSFPSFQALGGHRASHKKPKVITLPMEEKKQFSLVLSNDGNHEETQLMIKRDYMSPFYSLSLRMGNSRSKSPKVHKCSYCGAEFASGQALGGHMRRHRPPPAVAASSSLSTTPMSPVVIDNQEDKKQPTGNVLSLALDLNLPAPEDDNSQPEAKFCFFSQQQQQEEKQSTLVLSTTPTLVDCHY